MLRSLRRRRRSKSPGLGEVATAEPGLLANSGALVASRLAIAVLGWSGTVLISRSLSLEQFGQFTLIFTVLGLMSVITDMGIGRIAVSGMLDSSSADPGAFAGTYVVLRATLGAVGYVLVLLVVWAVGYPAVVLEATAVAGVVILLATPSHALDVVFQARLRMGTVAASHAGGMLAQLALTAAIAAAGGSVLLFTVPAVLCELVVICWKLPLARRLLPLRFRVELRTWRALLREAAPLSLGIGLATVYYRIDTVLLSKLDSFDSVGIYGVAYKFVDVMHFVATAVTIPLLTLLVRAWPADLSGYRDALRRGAALLGLLGGLALTGLLGFAGPVTSILYGANYAAGADATRVLALSELLTFFASLALTCLIAAGRHRGYPLVMLGGLVLNIGLNLVAIPRWSYLGAAFATLVTELVVATVMWSLLLRLDGVRPLRLGGLVGVPVAVGVALAVGAGADQVVAWPVAATAACLVYVGVAGVLGVTRAAGLAYSVLGPGHGRHP